MTYTITKNEEYKSFEIHFDAKPDAKTREALKALKFRWHAVRGIWYGYADDENAIRAAIDGAPAAEAPEAPASAKEKPIKSIWNRTRTDELPAYGTENAIKAAIKADEIKTLEQIISDALDIDNTALAETATELLEELKSHEQEVTQ